MNSLKLIFHSVITLFLCNQLLVQINIDGKITDAELNPIDNALVEIIDEDDSSNVYSTSTNNQGYFNISVLTDIRSAQNQIPNDFIILRNYPNPFNPSTIIYYELPKSENIKIIIYDILGRKVRTLYNNFHKAGIYTLDWDGRNDWNSSVSAGIYFCRLKTKDQFKVHKMVLLDGGSTFASATSAKMKNPNQQIISKLNSHFYFSVKVSGSNILESEFQDFYCSNDTTLNLLVPKILQTAIIGPEGGKLETEDFSLGVPEGAFSETTELKLSIDTDSVSFEEKLFSKPYRIDGIPELFFEDLGIKIKLDQSTSDSISIGVGETDKATFLEYEFLNYNYYSAEDSSGYAITNFSSPFTNNIGLSKSIKKPSIEKSSYTKKLMVVLASPNTVISSKGNFKFYYPDSKALFIPVLDEYLEEAVEVIESIGFSKSPLRSLLSLSNWPMKVKFNKLEGDEDWDAFQFLAGASCFSFGKYKNINDKNYLIKNWEIIINTNNFLKSYPDNLRRTLGRDVFWNFNTQNLLFGNYDLLNKWLTGSLAIWVTELFPKDDSFVPFGYNFNNAELIKHDEYGLIRIVLDGIHFTEKWDTHRKMSAFSALIDFLTTSTEQGDKIIFDIFNKIISGKSSEEALIKALNETENIWWPNFFKEFIQGNIYNLPGEEFLKNITETIVFNDGDTLKYTDKTYNDLSAKLFKININSDDIKNNKSLNFKIGPESLNLDYVKALVFGLSENNLNFITEGIDFSVGNLHKYDDLLVCVVNSGNEPPYTGTSNIDLFVKTKDSNLPYEGKIEIIGKFSSNLHYKSETEERDVIGSEAIDYYWNGEVKLINDSTYWGEWDYVDQIGYNQKGQITVIIDPITKNLKFFEAETIRDGDWWTVINEKIVSFYTNMPYYFTPSTTRWYYRAANGDACGVINTLEYTQGNENWSQTLTGFSCNDNSYVSISFYLDE